MFVSCQNLGVSPAPAPCPMFFFSLKLECDKLASEKSEMQRHYVMVSRLRSNGWGGGEPRPACTTSSCR